MPSDSSLEWSPLCLSLNWSVLELLWELEVGTAASQLLM